MPAVFIPHRRWIPEPGLWLTELRNVEGEVKYELKDDEGNRIEIQSALAKFIISLVEQ